MSSTPPPSDNDNEGTNENTPSVHLNTNDNDSDNEAEECVICLEELNHSPWGRCTPCKHAFHQECWWKWENSHYERLERQRLRGHLGRNNNSDNNNDGPKCCLCNMVNESFVNENGDVAPNPHPFVSSFPESNDNNSNSPRRNNFFDWFRGWRSQSEQPQQRQPETENRERDRRNRESWSRQQRQWRDDEARERAQSFMENLQRQGASIFGGLDPRVFVEQLERDWGPDPFGFGVARGNVNSNNNNHQNGNNRGGSGINANELLETLSRSLGVDPSVILEQFNASRSETPPTTSPHPRSSTSTQSTNNNTTTPTHTEFNTFPNGTPVTLQNLINSSHLNGQDGKILRYLHTTGSYYVQLESNPHSPVAVKQSNLLQQIKITIRGIVSLPHLNGKSAIITSYSRERDRYAVRFTRLSSIGTGCNREISIQPTNMLIPDGTIVRLEGLERHPQWNGKWGKVVRCEVGGRYEVRLSRMYSVRVKMENVRL